MLCIINPEDFNIIINSCCMNISFIQVSLHHPLIQIKIQFCHNNPLVCSENYSNYNLQTKCELYYIFKVDQIMETCFGCFLNCIHCLAHL